MNPVKQGSLLGAAIGVVLLFIAVCAAAVTAHVAIDIIGDYALPHDAYDGIGHSSRLGVVVAAIGLVFAGAAGVLWSAFDARRSGARRPMRIVRNPAVFYAAVIGLSLAGVAGMESLDALLDGDSIGGIADAFGGSVWLGVLVTLPLALSFGALALRLSRFIERTRSKLVRAIEAFIAELTRSSALADPCVARERPPLLHLLAVHIGRAHKRGPPCAA